MKPAALQMSVGRGCFQARTEVRTFSWTCPEGDACETRKRLQMLSADIFSYIAYKTASNVSAVVQASPRSRQSSVLSTPAGFTVAWGPWWCSSWRGSACCRRPSGRAAGARPTGGRGSSGWCSWPWAESAPGSGGQEHNRRVMALTSWLHCVSLDPGGPETGGSLRETQPICNQEEGFSH